jgi:hypothetical protein
MMPAAQVAVRFFFNSFVRLHTNLDTPKAIYSSIPGAVLSPDSNIPLTKFSTTYDVWVVPCNASVNVVATFG